MTFAGIFVGKTFVDQRRFRAAVRTLAAGAGEFPRATDDKPAFSAQKSGRTSRISRAQPTPGMPDLSPSPAPAATPGEAADGLPAPQRYWAALAIWLAIGMAVMDAAIANVALPTMARELSASAASSIWIINAYQLAITVCLLPLAALGDKFGYRRVYIVGLGIFTLGSLGCALSDSLHELVAARIVQGVGAAGVMSVNSALVRFTYPLRLLGRGIGLNAVVISISAALGPSLAAAILAHGTWHWLFAINVPTGVLAAVVGLCALPRAKGAAGAFDLISALLNAVTFGFLIFGAESLARDGIRAGLTQLAIGLAAAIVLVRRELRRPIPLVPFDLLKLPIYGLSAATSILSFAAMTVTLITLPFFLQGQLGRSVVETGLLMTPSPIAIGVSAPLAGRLADRYHPGGLGGIGMGLFAIGVGALGLLQPGASDLDIVWRTALCGFGFGFFQSPNNRAMTSSAPRSRSGASGGMMSTARVLGQTAGAVTMAIFFRLAGVAAVKWAFAIGLGIAASAALLSITRLRLPAGPGAPQSQDALAS